MNAAKVFRSRGTIIKVPDATPGILFADGQQQYFVIERVWKSPVAPAANQVVDLEFDGRGALMAITVIDALQSRTGKLDGRRSMAHGRRRESTEGSQQRTGGLARYAGSVALGAGVLLWIAWFFFPAAAFAGGMAAPVSLTFWSLLGTDFNDPRQIVAAGNNHGWFAIVGLAALAAPFAAPFIRVRWSRYLNAAPCAYVLIAIVAIYRNESKAFSEISKLAGSSPFSFSWGIFAVAMAAIIPAGAALIRRANA